MSITVLICVHSKSRVQDNLLKAALRSLINQTYQEFNVVIVFDECWKQTKIAIIGELLTLMQTHSVCTILKDKKTGLANAKNLGLQWVNTEWVAFLDADDEFMPNKLEKQVYYLDNFNVDILSTHYWWRDITFSEDSYVLSVLRDSCFRTDQYITHEQIRNRLSQENVLCHGAIIMKMSIFDNIKYNNSKEYLGREDWKLWLDCMKAGYKFYQFPERLYIYTRNPKPVR